MTQPFDNYTYDHLRPLQVGRIGEYWVKIWFILLGFDVYTTEVDDKGIDFVIRLNHRNYIDIQVKTIREKTGYVFVNKDSRAWAEPLKNNLFLALVVLKNNHTPTIYLIPASEWNSPTELLKSRDYIGSAKSKPDWGINISRKNTTLLTKYEISKVVAEIKSNLSQE